MQPSTVCSNSAHEVEKSQKIVNHSSCAFEPHAYENSFKNIENKNAKEIQRDGLATEGAEAKNVRPKPKMKWLGTKRNKCNHIEQNR